MGELSVKNKVLIAMSGGVDSSVAAALLKEQEYDLIGVTMTLYCSNSASERSCCSASAAADAKKVADRLGFPHYTINFKDDFQRSVIHNFIEEYKAGRTPNPCVRCNQFLKFDLLPRKAREMGAEFVATGHYARIMANDQFQMTNEGKASYILFKGKDPKKDQSYFLYRLTQGQLAHTLFPLGELTKEEVRLKARALGLPVAEKKESQEICFIEDDNYGRFLREKVPEVVRPGPIIDKYGNKVGEHEGLVFFTIGQRKGVGAHREPRYVIGLDNAKNAVVIGSKEETYGTELTAEDLSFISGRLPVGPLAVTAKIRYNAVEAAATVTRDQEGAARVVFAKPQLAITPGQSVVFYKGEEVLGGGIISRKDK